MMPGKAAPAPAPEPQDGDVLATLGKRKIVYGDFIAWLKLMAGPRAEMVRKNPPNRAQAQKQYLELQVLAAKGKRDKLQATPGFKALLAAMEQQCYGRILLDEDRPGSAAQKMKEQAENPTDDELQAFYKANIERYATPEKVTTRHLLVSLKGANGGKPLTEEEAKARLAKVQEELKAGKKLEDLTKEYSDDAATRDKGGLNADMPYGRFGKEYEEAARKQELGQVGGPVSSANGYYLVQVVARTPKDYAAFDKVKDGVKRQLVPERKAKAKEAFMEAARKEVGYKEVPEAAPQAPKAAATH